MVRLIALLAVITFLGIAPSTEAAKARIIKVLPHLLDQNGQHTLAPSLYERDAYQARLRTHPEMVSAMRFDIQWSGTGISKKDLKMRAEIRTAEGALAKPIVIEESVKPKGLFSFWSTLTLDREGYQKAKRVIAWRVTLWDGDKQIGEQKSFLW